MIASSASSCLDRGDELGGRRVRRLTAGDDADRPDRLGERLEETPVPLPGHHRDDPALRARGRDERETPLALFLLLVHVGDLDSLDRARGGAERERGAGVVRVDVHLERGLVADHHERVAEPLELRLEPVAVERLPLDHEDGAVAVAGGLEMDGLDAGRRLGGGRGRQRLAGDRAGQPAEELDEPRAARVDHSRLAQDLELVGRAGHGLLPVSHELDEQCRRAARTRPRAAPPPPRARG